MQLKTRNIAGNVGYVTKKHLQSTRTPYTPIDVKILAMKITSNSKDKKIETEKCFLRLESLESGEKEKGGGK